MRFRQVTLQGFRNLPLVSIRLVGARTFLCGANAQGKTNFLEAVGYVTALRSFRGAESRTLLGVGQPQTGLAFVVEHEQFGESRIAISFTPQGREVTWEQGRVKRLADFIGKFPTVVFSSQDNQFLRGSPALRRRWLDLTLAAMDPAYLLALQSYTRAVAERNMLLKQGGRDAAALTAFERELAHHAAVVVLKRTAGVAELSELFRTAHARLVPADDAVSGRNSEQAGLVHKPDSTCNMPGEFANMLVTHRARDLVLKTTERGPHRDDLDLLLNALPAKQFASEGQQRCLVIALRLAQAAYFKLKSGITPVLLCDDILGELDPERRRKFWTSLEGDPQVIATGTSLPPSNGTDWQVLQVEQGTIREVAKENT